MRLQRKGARWILDSQLPEAHLKFDIPEKIDSTLFKQMGLELLALLGCLALAGTLALAVRLSVGKW